MSHSFVGDPEVLVFALFLLLMMFVPGQRVPSPGQPSKVQPKDLLAHRSVSSVYRGLHARSVILDTLDILEARRFVSEPTLIYGVLYDRPSAPFPLAGASGLPGGVAITTACT